MCWTKIDGLIGVAGLLFAGLLLDILGIMRLTPSMAFLLGSLGTTVVVIWGIWREQRNIEKFELEMNSFFQRYDKINRIPTRSDIKRIARKRRKR